MSKNQGVNEGKVNTRPKKELSKKAHLNGLFLAPKRHKTALCRGSTHKSEKTAKGGPNSDGAESSDGEQSLVFSQGRKKAGESVGVAKPPERRAQQPATPAA